MTPEYTAKILPIITAYAEGKTIQKQRKDGSWFDIDNPVFSAITSRYRIKPEPKRYRVAEHRSNLGPVLSVTYEGMFKHVEESYSFVRWVTPVLEWEMP